MICISIGNIALVKEVNRLNPQLIELRYDLLLKDPREFSKLFNNKIKQIATCRQGKYSEDQSLLILKNAIEAGATYVDIEIERSDSYRNTIKSIAKQFGTEVIISYHNYKITPSISELGRLLDSCYKLGGDIAKIACMVNTEKDSARLLSLYAEEGRKVILGMGDKGRITRIAALELGSEFTFAALSELDITAPGQLSFAKIKLINQQIHNK